MDCNLIFIAVGVTCFVIGIALGQYGAAFLNRAPVVTISHLGGSDRIWLNGTLGNDDLTGKWQRIPRPTESKDKDKAPDAIS